MRSSISFFGVALMAILLLQACDTPPSPNSKTFFKYYGQDGFQSCVDMEVDADGNFYMLGNNGTTATDVHSSLFMIKVDANGNLVWKQTIVPEGGTEQFGLDGKDIELLSDGGIVVLANYYKTDTDHDLFVGRYSRENGIERDHARFEALPLYGSADPSKAQDDLGVSITEITSGGKGFIIAGSANNLAPVTGSQHERDGIHVRLDDALVPYTIDVWKDVQGAGNINFETKVIQVSDDEFFSFGYASKPDGTADVDFVVVKLKSDGNPQTMLDPGGVLGTSGNMERLGSVCVATGFSNTYFLSGITTPSLGPAPTSSLFVAELVQVNDPTDGILLKPVIVPKQPDYQLKSPSQAFTSSAVSASGGFFVLTNELLSGPSQILLTKIGSDGSGLWGAHPPSFGGLEDDYAGSVRELRDGRIVVGGTVSLNGETKMVLMKLNKEGHLAD